MNAGKTFILFCAALFQTDMYFSVRLKSWNKLGEKKMYDFTGCFDNFCQSIQMEKSVFTRSWKTIH